MARIGMYHAQHKSEEEIIQSMTALPAEIGIVMGDETRVTQVLTNLMRLVIMQSSFKLSLTLLAIHQNSRQPMEKSELTRDSFLRLTSQPRPFRYTGQLHNRFLHPANLRQWSHHQVWY